MNWTDTELMRAAVVEGLRCWIDFDGPHSRLVVTDSPKISRESIREIAARYNFRRNISSMDEAVDAVGRAVDTFRNAEFNTLSDGANENILSKPRRMQIS